MVQLVKFGVGEKPLTVSQEAILSVLYLAEVEMNTNQTDKQVLWVSGTYFIHTLGMLFESYHRGLMRDLERLGWIRIWQNKGTLNYSLSHIGRETKGGHFWDSNSCTVLKERAPF